MESLGRGTQVNKLHLQAADHLGWQVKNILQHETFLRSMLHGFSWRILKVIYSYSTQSQSHLMSYVVVSVV